MPTVTKTAKIQKTDRFGKTSRKQDKTVVKAVVTKKK